jgi:hypothetical protein
VGSTKDALENLFLKTFQFNYLTLKLVKIKGSRTTNSFFVPNFKFKIEPLKQDDQRIRKICPIKKRYHKHLPSQKGQNIFIKSQFERLQDVQLKTFESIKYPHQTVL